MQKSNSKFSNTFSQIPIKTNTNGTNDTNTINGRFEIILLKRYKVDYSAITSYSYKIIIKHIK